MKKILILFVLSIHVLINSEQSYSTHRYSGLQVYVNPLSPKCSRITKLEKILDERKNIFSKEAIHIALFTAQLDTLSEKNLFNFKDLLEKELFTKKLFKENTIHHKIDFLLAQALWEDKFTKNGQSYKKENAREDSTKSSFFYKNLTHDLRRMLYIKEHNPLLYAYELTKLLEIDKTQSIPNSARCYITIAYALSPIKIKIISK